MEKICRRYFISGKVQGVWYRASAKEQADELNITGFAKNLSDGRVEVIACGQEDELIQFEEWLAEGTPAARVDHIDKENIDWQNYEGFSTASE